MPRSILAMEKVKEAFQAANAETELIRNPPATEPEPEPAPTE